MKKFKFRLDRVLQYRDIVKGEKLKDLLQANQKVNAIEDRLKDLHESQLNNLLPTDGITDVERFFMAGVYGRRIRDELIQQGDELVKEQKVAEEALAVYIEAARDSRTLETLRDKKKKEYGEYVLKEEERFLDELVTQKRKS